MFVAAFTEYVMLKYYGSIKGIKEDLGELNYDVYIVYLCGTGTFYSVNNQDLLIEDMPCVRIRYSYGDVWRVLTDKSLRNPIDGYDVTESRLIELLKELDEQAEREMENYE